MKRIDFLINMIGGAMTLSALPTLTAPAKVKEQETLLTCPIAGLHYYDGVHKLDAMKEGDVLTLKREPNNKFDEYAIVVYWREEKLGYIPRTDNKILSKLLVLESFPILAEIEKIYPNSFHAIWIKVYGEK